MKKIIVLVVLSVVLLQRCSQDEPAFDPLADAQVTFSFTEAIDSSARSGVSTIVGATKLVVSIVGPTGEEVMTHQSVNINSTTNGYISEPVVLGIGHYRVSDFYLVDDAANVLYAVPHKGSALAKFVKHPLDQDFAVSIHQTTNLPVQVMEVDGYDPQDFGYHSFTLEALKYFPVAIHIIKNGKPAFAAAEAYILQEGDTISSNEFGTSANNIGFAAESSDTLQLVVIKDGYARFTQDFRLDSMLAKIGTKPFDITLTPAFTFRVTTQNSASFENKYTNFFLGSATGKLTLDWGDGVVEDVPIVDYGDNYITAKPSHKYSTSDKNHFVTVTGDVNLITGIDANPVDLILRDYNVKCLTNLTEVNFFVGAPGGLLDLSYNTNLVNIVAGGDSLILPKLHKISSFHIDGDVSLGSSVNLFVDNIYKNTVSTNIKNGVFSFSGNSDGTDTPGFYIGNPTAASLTKLKKLRDTYGWKIVPNPQ